MVIKKIGYFIKLSVISILLILLVLILSYVFPKFQTTGTACIAVIVAIQMLIIS
jgi:hypothetical protein